VPARMSKELFWKNLNSVKALSLVVNPVGKVVLTEQRLIHKNKYIDLSEYLHCRHFVAGIRHCTSP